MKGYIYEGHHVTPSDYCIDGVFLWLLLEYSILIQTVNKKSIRIIYFHLLEKVPLLSIGGMGCLAQRTVCKDWIYGCM